MSVIWFKPRTPRLCTVVTVNDHNWYLQARGFLHSGNDVLYTAFWKSEETGNFALTIGFDDQLIEVEGDFPQAILDMLTDDTPYFSTHPHRLDPELLAEPRLIWMARFNLALLVNRENGPHAFVAALTDEPGYTIEVGHDRTGSHLEIVEFDDLNRFCALDEYALMMITRSANLPGG